MMPGMIAKQQSHDNGLHNSKSQSNVWKPYLVTNNKSCVKGGKIYELSMTERLLFHENFAKLSCLCGTFCNY